MQQYNAGPEIICFEIENSVVVSSIKVFDRNHKNSLSVRKVTKSSQTFYNVL